MAADQDVSGIEVEVSQSVGKVKIFQMYQYLEKNGFEGLDFFLLHPWRTVLRLLIHQFSSGLKIRRNRFGERRNADIPAARVDEQEGLADGCDLKVGEGG